MNVERLRKIILYSDYNREETYPCVKQFCSFAGIEYDSELLNFTDCKVVIQKEEILYF